MAGKKKLTKLEEHILEEKELSLTFNPLMTILRENDKKNLFSTNITTAFHKTGFHLFDYYFGSVVNIHDKLGEIVKQEARVGQAAGTFNMVIGNTGSGKTTLAAQLGANIIRQFPNAHLIHYDCEQRFGVTRAQVVSKLPISYFENNRYIIKDGAVGLDTMQETIIKLYAAKMKMKKDLMIKTQYKDEFGKDVEVMEPTVIIIDSITSVLSETFSPDNAKDVADAEKLRGNTEGARDAKSLKGFFKDILPLCKEANIIIYAINHINTNMSMNAFVPVARQQNYLKQDESIPGGKVLLYYPFNIIKLTAKPGDNYTEESDGFAGHVVMVEPIKSSSNQSGNNSKGVSFEMVFSFKNGFDAIRTLINYARERGIIEGNRTRYKFKENPDYTFSLKNIGAELKEKPIWDDIAKYIMPELDTHLPYVEPDTMKFDERIFDYAAAA